MSAVVQRTTINNKQVEEAFPKPEKRMSTTVNISKINKIKPNSYIKEKNTWPENLKNYFSQYCKSSGVHGVRYLGESGRFIIEKVVWSITLITMCYLCVSLILKAFNKWSSSPVIVTFATTETPIWKIPFPAVTICSEIKSDPDIFNYSNIFLKKVSDSYVTPEENEVFEGLTLVCPGVSVLPELIAKLMENSSYTVNASAITNIFDVSPPITYDGYTIWQGKLQNKDILSDIYTSQGLCYSFNIIDPKELLVDPEEYRSTSPFTNYTKPKRWSLEKGYSNEDKINVFPRRTFISGVTGGLTIDVITNNSHIDRLCSEANEGFQVTIHHPAEFPNMDASFRLPLDQIVSVAIKPKMITVSEELKYYTPEYRKCYFFNERNLTYFRSYSQQNCLAECLMNYTIQQCGCIAFYMPKSKSVPICGPASTICVEKSRVNYLLSNSSNTTDCNCLPSCTSLQYEVEISQSDWAWRETFLVLRDLLGSKYLDVYSDFKMFRLSRLTVYFKEMQFLALERNELYGRIEFFSNTGGLLGLFIGFSITSAIEILYFLTLRVICNIKKYGRTFWSGQDSIK